MPTPTKGPRLGGSPAHERLILANLATALFEHGRITTTQAKAKRVRPLAERMITFAKRGDLHARRRVMTVIRDKDVVHTLFTEIGPSYAGRPGGYTRITKIGPRKGDNAPMAVIELVEPMTEQAVAEAEGATKRAAKEKAIADAEAAAAAKAAEAKALQAEDDATEAAVIAHATGDAEGEATAEQIVDAAAAAGEADSEAADAAAGSEVDAEASEEIAAAAEIVDEPAEPAASSDSDADSADVDPASDADAKD